MSFKTISLRAKAAKNEGKDRISWRSLCFHWGGKTDSGGSSEERAHDRECFSDRGPIHGHWTLEVRPSKVDGTDRDMQDKVMRDFLNAKAHSRENVICRKLPPYCKGQSLGTETSTEKESENNADDRQESLCFWKRPWQHHNSLEMVLWDSGEKEGRSFGKGSLTLELEQVKLSWTSCLSPLFLRANLILAYPLNHP